MIVDSIIELLLTLLVILGFIFEPQIAEVEQRLFNLLKNNKERGKTDVKMQKL